MDGLAVAKRNQCDGCEYQYLHLIGQGFRYAWVLQLKGESYRYWQLTELFKKLRRGKTTIGFPNLEAATKIRVALDAAASGVEVFSISAIERGWPSRSFPRSEMESGLIAMPLS